MCKNNRLNELVTLCTYNLTYTYNLTLYLQNKKCILFLFSYFQITNNKRLWLGLL